LERPKKNTKKTTEAALSSHVATLDTAPDDMADPQMAFVTLKRNF
jgi:hypothetical protein